MLAFVTIGGGSPSLTPCGGVYRGRAATLSLPHALLFPDLPLRARRAQRKRRETELALLWELCSGLRLALPEKRLMAAGWHPGSLGLVLPDRRQLLLTLAPRLALLALGERDVSLAAVHTDGRMSRAAAAVIAALCSRVRAVAVLPELPGGPVCACYGAADLCSADSAELHVLLGPPADGFSPRPDAVVFSLCGDFPCLPPGSYIDAAQAPPEEYLLRSYDATWLAAALAECGMLRPEQVRIDRLIPKKTGTKY